MELYLGIALLISLCTMLPHYDSSANAQQTKQNSTDQTANITSTRRQSNGTSTATPITFSKTTDTAWNTTSGYAPVSTNQITMPVTQANTSPVIEALTTTQSPVAEINVSVRSQTLLTANVTENISIKVTESQRNDSTYHRQPSTAQHQYTNRSTLPSIDDPWANVQPTDWTYVRMAVIFAMAGTPLLTFLLLAICRVRVILVTKHRYNNIRKSAHYGLSTITLASEVSSEANGGLGPSDQSVDVNSMAHHPASEVNDQKEAQVEVEPC
ncbi:mucin-2-like [Ptychodera flava]|uniref:mucin-2-like n=1 Tax=Ptychodera flava TaxID=63121 RepID=UPI00396A8C17